MITIVNLLMCVSLCVCVCVYHCVYVCGIVSDMKTRCLLPSGVRVCHVRFVSLCKLVESLCDEIWTAVHAIKFHNPVQIVDTSHHLPECQFYTFLNVFSSVAGKFGAFASRYVDEFAAQELCPL